MANITYRQVSDYMIPNLTLSPEESAIRLGKWGMMHKDYLQKHNPVLFATLLTQGNLYQHCAQIDTQAQQMFNTLKKCSYGHTLLGEKMYFIDFGSWSKRPTTIFFRLILKFREQIDCK